MKTGDLKDYFQAASGVGILATADVTGKVNAAVYGKPHFMDDETLAFIMAERLTLRNLQSNPYACYIFRESGEGYRGRRLYLTKTKEVADNKLADELRRGIRHGDPDKQADRQSHVVYFHLDKALPLVGTGEA